MTIKPLDTPLVGRMRSEPWFAAGAQDRIATDTDGIPYGFDDLVPRDDMFVSKSDAIAHLAFALSGVGLGSRVSLTQLVLESGWMEMEVPKVVTRDGLRVDYLYPDMGVAVLWDEDYSQAFTVRLDSILDIAVTSKS